MDSVSASGRSCSLKRAQEVVDASAAAGNVEEALPLKQKQLDMAPSDGAIRTESLPRGPRLGSLGQQGQKQGTSVLKTTLVICVWFVSNIGILLLNKHLLGGYGFKFPVFLTLCHMLACVILSQVAAVSGLVRHQPLQSGQQLMKVAVLASAFLLSVVLGNVSLRFIPVSFSQAIGAMTPAATAFMALALLGTVEKAVTYMTLVPVMAGIILATGFEPSFNSFGFLAAVGACGARAFKAVLQGILLADQSEKLDSINLLRLMAPIAATMLLPAVAHLEPMAPGMAWRLILTRPSFAALLVGNASLAYIVNFTNFQITHYTSALTLQVLGCAKGVLATVVSVLIFQNPVTIPGAAGYAMTVVGVFAYGYTKRKGSSR